MKAALKKELEKTLQERGLLNSPIKKIQRLYGGSINNAYALQCGRPSYFIKFNERGRYPGMFASEIKGLNLLRQTNALRIPEVICQGELIDQSFLLLEYIEAGNKEPPFWEIFGRSLAKLHQNHSDSFGLDHSNYIGSLPQSNKVHTSWSNFFIEERLIFQEKMAVDNGRMNNQESKLLSGIYKVLPELFPVEPPSLLHGDLWSGNFLNDQSGEPVIFDPAVYFGHREMDIAMSHLFGGFHKRFYQAYHEAYPLQKGWEERLGICNLYPLLVHVNLFGGAYLSRVKSVVKRFS